MANNEICSEKQYNIVATRRNTFDTMLWQTPSLSLTAQAFLLNLAGNRNADEAVRIAACILALCIAVCTVQLFARHRHFIERDARLLEEFENNHQHLGYAVINREPEWKKKRWRIWRFFKPVVDKMSEWPSFPIWMGMLIVFVVVALWLLVHIICASITATYTP